MLNDLALIATASFCAHFYEHKRYSGEQEIAPKKDEFSTIDWLTYLMYTQSIHQRPCTDLH